MMIISRRASILPQAPLVVLAVHYAGDLRGRHGGQRAARGANARPPQEHTATHHWNCYMVWYFKPFEIIIFSVRMSSRSHNRGYDS